jgi:hypothetical protein
MFTEKDVEYLEQIKIPVRFVSVKRTRWPVVLSLWYIYEKGKIWCATQNSAKIVKIILGNSKCGFEIASEKPPYRGIRGEGEAMIDKSRGIEILEKLLLRYLGGQSSSLAKKLLANKENEVAIEIEPLKIFRWDYTNRMLAASFK